MKNMLDMSVAELTFPTVDGLIQNAVSMLDMSVAELTCQLSMFHSSSVIASSGCVTTLFKENRRLLLRWESCSPILYQLLITRL